VHLTTLFASQLNINANGNGKEKKDQQSGCMLEEHHAEFLKLIAEHANCKPEEILDMDLYLYDTQPAVSHLVTVVMV
jgi:aspartyl aminopeptidase